MKGSEFTFNGINYLYYGLNRITISKGGSYIESTKWLKDKKCTINQKRISKIKPFIDNYNWNDINDISTYHQDIQFILIVHMINLIIN